MLIQINVGRFGSDAEVQARACHVGVTRRKRHIGDTCARSLRPEADPWRRSKRTTTNLVGCSTDFWCERVTFPEGLLAHRGLGKKNAADKQQHDCDSEEGPEMPGWLQQIWVRRPRVLVVVCIPPKSVKYDRRERKQCKGRDVIHRFVELIECVKI